MRIRELNNKQIIKINDLKFKKTPGMINFAKQIKFITQKRMLIEKEEKNIKNYYEKNRI